MCFRSALGLVPYYRGYYVFPGGEVRCNVYRFIIPVIGIATGRAEVMIDPVMNLWDVAPLQPIIEEAGGTFTDWSGQPTIHSGEAIASNGLVAAEVLALVRQP